MRINDFDWRADAANAMKIALVHNFYRIFGGEDAVVADLEKLLTAQGHQVCRFCRDSHELGGVTGAIKAFAAGVWNPFAARRFAAFLDREKPDLVHIHNLFPLISPAILPVCRKKRVPVVMTVHNYRLICPTGLFYSHGAICERCSGGHEWNCLWRNCENSRVKSAAYALRNWWARINRCYLGGVDHFLALTEFQRNKLVGNGFPAERITVLPNMFDNPSAGISPFGAYVAYAGRLNPEKGIGLILAAAAKLPQIPFKIAGSGAAAFRDQAPSNVEFIGLLPREQVADFFRNCRFAIMASTWYEPFGMVLIEAMSWGKPLIVPDSAGFPEIVADGVNGLLFRSGDADDLAEKIGNLFADRDSCDRFSADAVARFRQKYTPQSYYRCLYGVYETVVRNGK